MIKFSSKLLTAASNAIINEAKTRYGKNPKFPQDDAGVKSLFEALDAVIPKEAQAVSMGKQLYLWLLKQLYVTSQAADPLEDLPRIRPLMVGFWKATRPGGILQGEAANINHYRDLEELEEALTEKEEEDPEKETHSTSELAEIKKGAKVIYQQGEFILWKVPQTSDTWIKNNTGGDNESKLGVFRAAYLLCSNAKNNTSWCVGYDTNGRSSYASSYIPNGDFFVLQKNGRAIYAISSEKGRTLTMWNPADTPVMQVGSGAGGGSNHRVPSVEAGAQKAGIPFDLGGISAVPPELIAPLAAVRKTEPTIQLIPEEQLNISGDKTNLIKALLSTDSAEFAKDMSSMYSNRSAYVMAHALMSLAVSPQVHMEFDERAFQQMNQYSVMGYLEALAPTQNRDKRRIPAALDAILLPLVAQWGKGR